MVLERVSQIFFGHIMRRKNMVHMTAGKIFGKRNRGRQRKKMLDSFTSWQEGVSEHKLINAV